MSPVITLDRVCREVEQLIKKWPDRLTMASTGGPVTGHDENDQKGWQSNTRKLEASGVMGIEYSLSCPQGGDGTEGDIVSQNAALTAKIIDWIMEVGSPDIPKLFKLTAAVTSIVPILRAIRKVLDKYPEKKAGITLANSFPTLAFRPAIGQRLGGRCGHRHERRRRHAHLLSDARQRGPEGIEISGNGGPMTYKAAMDFLALGVKTVQFCTIATKYGYGIIRDLESGTAFLMQERGIQSMKELIGITQPHPITDFMALSPVKKVSDFNYRSCAPPAETAPAARTWPSSWMTRAIRIPTLPCASAARSAPRSASPARSPCATAHRKSLHCSLRTKINRPKRKD